MKTFHFKKRIFKMVVYGLAVGLLSTSLATGVTASESHFKSSFERVDPYTAIEEMGAGWNLGNTLDAIPTEGSWNNPPVLAKTFDDIKRSGIKSVRLPVTWTHHIGAAPDYKVDPVWMNRVEEVVDMALNRDLYVVLNVHHDSWEWADLSNKSNLEEKHKKLNVLWAQIADRFKNKSERLLFETLNEPAGSTAEDAEQYNIMNKSLLKVIRNSGGYNQERLVILPGLNTNIERTIQWFKNPDPTDRNLILTVHNYDPWGFVSRYYGITKWNDRNYFPNLFGQLHQFSEQMGMPVIIGEYGTLALGTVENQSKWVYTDSFVRAAHQYGMGTMLWEIGLDQFDRDLGEWKDPIVRDIILNATKGINNSFVDKAALYFEEGQQLVSDPSIQLELNGNSLNAIYHSGAQLTVGTDYIINGSTVILKKEYVSSKLNQLGVGATLQFKFSGGADQSVQLIKYKKPEIAVKEFTVKKGAVQEDLKIPTKFNGTTLATVTALEVNIKDNQTGTSLPMPVKNEWTNWMPNNEYEGLKGGIDFNDDYRTDGDFIYITKNLLNMMNDDTVLSFKFSPREKEVNVDVVIRVK